MKNKKLIITLSILLVGALGGFLYWKYVGCLTGTCAIKSNPYLMIGYGLLFGWVISDLVNKQVDKKEVSQ